MALIWNKDLKNIKNILEESIYQLMNHEDAVSYIKNKCNKVTGTMKVIYVTIIYRAQMKRLKKVSVTCES